MGDGGIIREVQSVRSKKNNNEKGLEEMGTSIQELNQMSEADFISTLGWIFESSPWIAEKAWGKLPFHSKEHLKETLVMIVQKAGKSAQLALLQAHPDLGTRLKISDVSLKEQRNAGLETLSEQEYEDLSLLNWLYVEKFGFPFIMAVKGQDKKTILTAIKERIYSSIDEEWKQALEEVFKIASYRLDDTILSCVSER